MRLTLLQRLLIALPMTALVVGVFVLYTRRESTTGRYKNVCLSNLRAIGAVNAMYWSDNDDHMPLENWIDALDQIMKNPSHMDCPDVMKTQKHFGYAMLLGVAGLEVGKVKEPEKSVMYFETDALGRNVVANLAARSGRHSNGSFLVFFDTHARYRKLGEEVK